MDDTAARRRRARRRATWPGAVLDAQTPAQLDTPVARLLSMEALARDAFGDPDVGARDAWPGRVVER